MVEFFNIFFKKKECKIKPLRLRGFILPEVCVVKLVIKGEFYETLAVWCLFC